MLIGGVIVLVISPKRGKPVELLQLPTPAPLVIYVTGAVSNPGVYELQSGSRVTDALQAAGGTLQEADITLINLAAQVTDGERLWVPLKVDPTEAAANAATSGRFGHHRHIRFAIPCKSIGY